jgi:hypothetical protein
MLCHYYYIMKQICPSYAFLQDFRPSEVYTCEFLLDNTQMGFLVADGDKNLVLYMYQPESRESFGGRFISYYYSCIHIFLFENKRNYITIYFMHCVCTY